MFQARTFIQHLQRTDESDLRIPISDVKDILDFHIGEADAAFVYSLQIAGYLGGHGQVSCPVALLGKPYL